MKGDEKILEGVGQGNLNVTEKKRTPSVITVDYGKYEHFLETADLSEDQKREFIDALWSIIVSFVDLGFGVHPAQQAENICGKLQDRSPKPPSTEANEVHWDSKFLTKNFEDAADLETDAAAGGVKT